MSEVMLTLSTFDVRRLEPLLNKMSPERHLPEHLSSLENKLSECDEAEPAAVPRDLVTMNSQVLLQDAARGSEMLCTLVFPRHANADEGRISVFVPLGTALFGARVGDTVEVRTPQGVREFLIRELRYQPESAGHYDR